MRVLARAAGRQHSPRLSEALSTGLSGMSIRTATSICTTRSQRGAPSIGGTRMLSHPSGSSMRSTGIVNQWGPRLGMASTMRDRTLMRFRVSD